MTAPASVRCTSGAHSDEPAGAQAGGAANASPTYSHSTRSKDRKCGTRRRPAPSPQSSEVAWTWNAPSAPRCTEGSGATEEITGLAAAVAVVAVATAVAATVTAVTRATTTRAADPGERTEAAGVMG